MYGIMADIHNINFAVFLKENISLAVSPPHLDRHPVEVDHAPHLLRHLGGGHALVQPVDVEVEVAVALTHHADAVLLRQLVQVELAVLAPRAATVGQDAAPGHHHGAGALGEGKACPES